MTTHDFNHNLTPLPLNTTPVSKATPQEDTAEQSAGITPHAMGLQLLLVSPADEQRKQVEQFIQQQYQQHFAARLNEFSPIILTVREVSTGRILGAVGLRYADAQPLFSEQYLSHSIQSLIADHEGMNVTRHSIIELGHFVVDRSSDVHTVIPIIGRFLKSLDVSWAVYTLSRPIKKSFARLGIQLIHLQHAHPQALQNSASDWGRYYDFKPAVYYSNILNNMNA